MKVDDPHQLAGGHRRAAGAHRAIRATARMLRAGVDLYELSARAHPGEQAPGGSAGLSLGRLHAKTAVIDRHDRLHRLDEPRPASEGTNTELGIIAESPELAREVILVD